MPLQFHVSIEGMKIWSASTERYSFVISFETLLVPAFAVAPAIWQRGARLMERPVQSTSADLHSEPLRKLKTPAIVCSTISPTLMGRIQDWRRR